LLWHVFRRPTSIQVGSLYLLADEPDGWIVIDAESGVADEFHCWLGDVSGNEPAIIDFSARHYPEYCHPGDPLARAIGHAIPWSPPPGFTRAAADRPVTWTRPAPPKVLWHRGRTYPSWVKFRPVESLSRQAHEELIARPDRHADLIQRAVRHYLLLSFRSGALTREDLLRLLDEPERGGQS
jgi:hypothetical protein